jgi:hypothetical protein
MRAYLFAGSQSISFAEWGFFLRWTVLESRQCPQRKKLLTIGCMRARAAEARRFAVRCGTALSRTYFIVWLRFVLTAVWHVTCALRIAERAMAVRSALGIRHHPAVHRCPNVPSAVSSGCG